MQQISPDERFVLDLYASPFAHEDARLAVLQARLGVSRMRVLLMVSELIDSERALAYAPVTVRRLLRLRGERARSRVKQIG